MNKGKITKAEKALFSKYNDTRLGAVDDVIKLPKVHAKRLLRDGLSHWDRLLRERCAEALVKLEGYIRNDKL